MVIANQAGWLILNPQKLAVKWSGAPDIAGLVIDSFDSPAPTYAKSHFGSGILTFNVDYLFRTPPGFNLWVRGPSNSPKDGISPLEGVVETDWAEATFTMNWKLTRAHQWVVFEKREPIAMILPMRRHELETFRPEIIPISEDADVNNAYEAWRRSRSQFNADLKMRESPAQKEGWQRHYSLGTTVTRRTASEHQTKLRLMDFIDKRKQRQEPQ